MNKEKISSDEAVSIYIRECEIRGCIFRQPSSQPELSKDLWVFSNIDGELARVDAKTGEVYF